MKSFTKFLQEKKETDQEKKHVVLSFGRFNPPHSGHEKLVNKVHEIADKHNSDYKIILSKSHDNKENPLEPHYKEHLMKDMFPKAKEHIELADDEHPTILHHVKKLNKHFDHLSVVAGDDRVTEYQQLLDKYNHRDYDYKSIKVHSSGKRTPSSEGVEGVSASKLRDYVKNGNFKDFAKSIPRHISDKSKKEVFNKVRKGMGLKEHKALFVVGPPCSGKDILITEVKKYFDIVETSLEQLQSRKKLHLEDHDNILISTLAYDHAVLEILETYLTEHGYDTKMIYTWISNEESQKRNEVRNEKTGKIISEGDRYTKWLYCNNNIPFLESIFDGKFINFDNSLPIEANMDTLLEVFQKINTFLNPKDSFNDLFETFYSTETMIQQLDETVDKKAPKKSFSKFVKRGPNINNPYDTRLAGGSFPYSMNVNTSESVGDYGEMSTVTMAGKDEMETLASRSLENMKPEPDPKRKKSFSNVREKKLK